MGRSRLVLDLSCRKREGQYFVVTDRWQRFSSLALSEATLACLAASCDEFLVHGVDVEGMQLGIDDKLVGLLGRWSPIPVTYAGGARTLVGPGPGPAGRRAAAGRCGHAPRCAEASWRHAGPACLEAAAGAAPASRGDRACLGRAGSTDDDQPA